MKIFWKFQEARIGIGIFNQKYEHKSLTLVKSKSLPGNYLERDKNAANRR